MDEAQRFCAARQGKNAFIRHGRPSSRLRDARYAEAIQAGKSNREIALLLGVSERHVYRDLERLGLRNPNRLRPGTVARSASNAGLTGLGASANTIPVNHKADRVPDVA